MTQKPLYYHAHIDDTALLYPDQLNGDYETYLLENIRETNEKRVANMKFIIKVNSIVEKKNGVIDMSNFGTNVIVPVKYHCNVCSPQENMIIIARVHNVSIKRLVVAENGPVVVAISGQSIDESKFVHKDNQIFKLSDNKPLDIGDYIKVIIVQTKYVSGSKNIVVSAKLIDMATEEEIRQYKSDIAKAYGDYDDEMI